MNKLVRNIIRLRFTLGKFSLVGLSGIFVNQGTLSLVHQLMNIDVKYAGIIAIELSILSNFLLNNFWTWKKGKSRGFLLRFLKYHLVTLISGGINYIILLSLVSIGLNYLIANLIGIGIGMIINFIINHKWTFNKQEALSNAKY